MSSCNCNCRCGCACVIAAAVSSVIIGIITAFLLITEAISVSVAFLWAAFGIAVLYLAVLAASASRLRASGGCNCLCAVLNAVLAGILGTVLFSLILLAVGIVAGSILSTILSGLLLGSFALIISGSACLVRCLADCGE